MVARVAMWIGQISMLREITQLRANQHTGVAVKLQGSRRARLAM